MAQSEPTPQDLHDARVRADRFVAEASAEIQEKLPEGETVDTAWNSLPPRLHAMVHALMKAGSFEKMLGVLLVKTPSGSFAAAYARDADTGAFVETPELLEALGAYGAGGLEFAWPRPRGR